MRSGTRTGVLVATALLALAACSEGEPTSGGGATTTTASRCGPDDAIVTCAPEGSTLDALLPDRPVAAAGDPIRIGTINQDTGPAGAFPELTRADQAAVDWINAELGGVDGRPLELVTCDTAFSPVGSQQCAQRMVDAGVVAVVGGIDVFGDGIEILADNDIPLVGGIPVSFPSVRSPVAFQFSGGTWGAVLGFASHAVDAGAERVSIVYGDFGPIADASRIGAAALEAREVEVQQVKTPVIGADWVAALNEAQSFDPDAIIALTADTGCVPAMQTAVDLRIEATVYVTGACAAPNILEEAGDAAEGRIFNIETELRPDDPAPDTVLYGDVIARYGEGLDAQGAGTVAFRSLMNLYVQMRRIGADGLTGAAIIAAMRAAVDEPSFSGYPYTCDGEQFPGLPAMCAPQQTLAERRGDEFLQVSDWIDVGAFAR